MEPATRRALCLLLLALGCGACASYSSVRFAPAVQDAELRDEDDELQAHIAVAWRGIAEQDGGQELRFRVRVDNPGPTPFTLVPADFELLDGALASFGSAAPENLPTLVPARQSTTFDIAFPTPPGQKLASFDLSALTLHTRFQGGHWTWSTTFHRTEPESHSSSSFGFSFGVLFGG